jgi:xyloglucan-specific endo-beta-1,4-glucanase
MGLKTLILATALAPLALAQSLCGQYDYYSSNGYYFNNNRWGQGSGSGNQCTYVDKIQTVGVSWHSDWNWSGGDNNVKAYPYSGRSLSSKKIVSSIGSMPTKAEWQYDGQNIRANVAYDIFTASNPNHDTSYGDYELMIWLGRLGGIYPIGSSTGFVNVGGRSWELFAGYNGAMRVYSFVASGSVTVWEGDVKPFFNYLASNQGYPASSQYLITYQFGTEPFTGSNARFNCWYWYGEVN